MKAFVVLQESVHFRVDWNDLHDESTHKLILISGQKNPFSLKKNQENCFEENIYLQDYSLPNLKVIIEELLAVYAGNLRIITNDEYCIDVAAELRQHFNIIGDKPQCVHHFRDKVAMKKLLANSSLLFPKYLRVEKDKLDDLPTYIANIEAHLNYPMFAKPIDSAGGKLTFKIENKQDLHHWLLHHASLAEFEIDEFINGDFYHCDSLTKNGKIVFSAPSKYAFPGFDFSKGKICGSISVPKSSLEYEEIINFNQQVIELFKPKNCATHLEFFRKKDGKLVFIEIGARAPGAMICEKHELEYGINLEKEHFKLQMGLAVEIAPITEVRTYCASAWFPKVKGKVLSIEEKPTLKSKYEIVWNIKTGQLLRQSTDLVKVAGSIIFWNSSFSELESDFSTISTCPLFNVEN